MKNKRSKEELEIAAINSYSIAEMCRKLGIKPVGGNYKIIHHAIKEYGIDISHFNGQGWNKGLKFNPKPLKKIEDILVEHSNYQSFKLKKRLFKEGLKTKVCECCGLSKWQNKEIPLELHHINGVNTDNRLENLQILCPNCHALTDTYRGHNIRVQPSLKSENETWN